MAFDLPEFAPFPSPRPDPLADMVQPAAPKAAPSLQLPQTAPIPTAAPMPNSAMPESPPMPSTDAQLPPLPNGFKLDARPPQVKMPPLPAGFTLDQPGAPVAGQNGGDTDKNNGRD